MVNIDTRERGVEGGPSFLTRTFHYSDRTNSFRVGFVGNITLDEDDFKYYKLGDKIVWSAEGLESLSIDGSYARTMVEPGITVGLPLYTDMGVPFMYINPLYKSIQKDRNNQYYALESGVYVGQAEVGLPRRIQTEEIRWVVIHPSENEIRGRMEDNAHPSDRESGRKSLQLIRLLKDRFRVIDEIPKTDYSDMVVENQEFMDNLLSQRDVNEETADDKINRARKIERKFREQTRLSFRTYGVNYENARDDMMERVIDFHRNRQ